ncbi:MAG TPA: AzlC family ABC transporter permease [Candidatus Tectomicrobia bacterium]|nr:AzlC family ABC transporter permease [Candidatus Tectomicrobia bacterium]
MADASGDGLGRRMRDGFVASLALVPSVFVYGTVFGGLAVQRGLWPVEVWAMSLLVFAGASQFVAVAMLADGASPLFVILTTYVVNMRHYLMAATLAPAFRAFPRRWLALVAHGINDESFAVAVARQNPPDPWFFIGSVAAIGGAFVGGVPVGTQLGGLVADPARWGLDFAFPAVFLAIVAVQLRRREDWAVAVASAALAVAIAAVLPGNWHIVIAGLAVSGGAALLLPPEPS